MSMPGEHCVLYGCCSSRRYKVSIFKIPSLRKEESEYTAALKLRARQEWIKIILQNRALTEELKKRIETSKVSICELHFKPDCILENPSRKGLVTGSIPTENIPLFRDQPRQFPSLQLVRPPTLTKKRKLDNEFSKESPKNAVSIGATQPVPVVNHDENIAPEQSCCSSSEVTKSRRKSSQVRKVVRTDVQGKVEEETNISQKIKSEASECLQKPECNERQVRDMVQDMNNTATVCGILTSSRSENMSIQTVGEQGSVLANRASETTVIEEDYQRKYFQLLNTMNDLQDKFLVSQRNFEDLVQAREAYINELQGTLEDKHQEIGSIKQELERSNSKIVELDEKRKMQEDEIQHLRKNVEDVKKAEIKHQALKDGAAEVQRIIEKQQQEVLEFYKLLTSVTVEKVVADDNDDSPTAYDKFRCSLKTAQAQDFKFMLVHDPEFAEVEYTPLALDSQSVDASFPEYLKEQIFFESGQAPNFLSRLIQTIQNPDDK